MSTTGGLLTVAEYGRIPNPPSGIFELHHGELVFVSAPTFQHGHIEQQILGLLKRHCEPAYYIANEMACRPLPEYEVWTVDVGMAVRERVRMIRDGWLIGAPDLAVEILSPSNSPREMLDRERTMFAGGCRQFWIVDGTKRTVRTSTPGGQPKTYESGESIPLDLFDSHAVAVDDIFIEP